MSLIVSARILGAGALLAVGCAHPIAISEETALYEQGRLIGRVGVARLRSHVPSRGDPERLELAGALIARHLAEAAAARGIDVIAPDDVERALELEPPERRFQPGPASRRAFQEFGARALLLGEVFRFRERGGEALGTFQPASLAFQVTLYAAPGGERLWSASFDETQRPLSENFANFFVYPGRGTRWLTAEELVRWAAQEVARALPVED